VRILRAAAFAEEDARRRLDRFLALNQLILALLDGSDSPVYSMSTHGEKGIAGLAVHQSRLGHHQQDSQAKHRQLTGSLIQGGRPAPLIGPSGAQHVGCTPADRAEAHYRRAHGALPPGHHPAVQLAH
jgi:hypothetical protein